MPPIPKFAKALTKLTKANPKIIKQDTNFKNNTNDKPEKSKLKPIASAKTPKITPEEKRKREGLIREKLGAWGKANEPLEGWYFEDTKDKLKEIKLRVKYLKEKPKILWLDYLEKYGLKVSRKVVVAKDDSEILDAKHKKVTGTISRILEKIRSQKLAKDGLELILAANKLTNTDLPQIEDFKTFFKIANSKLGNKTSMANEVKFLISLLDNPENIDKNAIKSATNKINLLAQQAR